MLPACPPDAGNVFWLREVRHAPRSATASVLRKQVEAAKIVDLRPRALKNLGAAKHERQTMRAAHHFYIYY
jgi:hypothetical protein